MSLDVRRVFAATCCLFLFAAAETAAQAPVNPAPKVDAPARPELPPGWDKMSAEERLKYRQDMNKRQGGGQGGQGDEAERMRTMREQKERAQAEAAPKKIEPPADREVVKASYTVDGVAREIKAGEFYDVYVLLTKFEERAGQPTTEENAYEQILLLAEARALGFDCTKEEFEADDPVTRNPVLRESNLQRWKKEGITEEMYRRYEIERRTIQKLRDFYLNTLRVDSQAIFEVYKRDHFIYRAQFVAFTAAEKQAELAKNPPAESELLRLWNDDKGVQNQFRTPTTIDAEFVYFDQSGEAEGAAPTAAESEVTNAEALSYYRRNKERLDSLLTAEQREAGQPSEKRPIDQIKSPFSFLKPQIEKEIRASGRVRVAFNDAKTDATVDLAALSAKYKLKHVKFEKAERQAFMSDPRFGIQIFGTLFNAEKGKLSSDLMTERQTQFFWRLNGKEASALPEFDKVKAKLPAVFYESAANQRAQDDAKAFRAALDAAVETELKVEIDAKNATADQNAEREAKSRNVTDPKQLDEIKGRHRNMAAQQMIAIKNTAAGRVFEKVATERGVSVVDTGEFELAPQRFDRGPGSVDQFVKSQQMLRNAALNSVSQVTSDAVGRAHVVYKLKERKDPDFGKISESDYLAMRAQAERTAAYGVASRLMYHEISRRMNLSAK